MTAPRGPEKSALPWAGALAHDAAGLPPAEGASAEATMSHHEMAGAKGAGKGASKGTGKSGSASTGGAKSTTGGAKKTTKK